MRAWERRVRIDHRHRKTSGRPVRTGLGHLRAKGVSSWCVPWITPEGSSIRTPGPGAGTNRSSPRVGWASDRSSSDRGGDSRRRSGGSAGSLPFFVAIQTHLSGTSGRTGKTHPSGPPTRFPRRSAGGRRRKGRAATGFFPKRPPPFETTGRPWALSTRPRHRPGLPLLTLLGSSSPCLCEGSSIQPVVDSGRRPVFLRTAGTSSTLELSRRDGPGEGHR